MTLENWQRDETKAFRLKELLSDPIMVEALTVATFAKLPRNMVASDKLEPLTALALTQSHSVGWYDCIRFIKEDLLKKPEPPRQSLSVRQLSNQ